MHQRAQTAILVMQKKVNQVTLEFGGDPNKRVLPGFLEEQGALVLNAPVLIGSLTTVVPSSPAFERKKEGQITQGLLIFVDRVSPTHKLIPWGFDSSQNATMAMKSLLRL